jgi:hypothetical protein
LKNRVAKTIAPKKKIICRVDFGIAATDSFFSDGFLFWKKSFRRKMPDKIMSNIPRQRGNIPVPDLRKVPMGIPKERTVVTAPNRKITTPPMVSALFKSFAPFRIL